MIAKSLILHGGLLVVSAGVAANAWLAEEDSGEKHEAELWGGAAAQITRIEYQAPDRTVVLTPKTDEVGRYWLGEVDREKPSPAQNPHAPPEEKSAEPGEREQVKFLGVDAAEELAEQLAPLRALRSLGVLDEARLAEFGFDPAEPKTTLQVALGGQTHQLLIGGKTPGGGHVYARVPESGQAYVLGGSVASDLGSAESRLIQRSFHSFEQEEAPRAKISAGESSRQLVRLEGQNTFWADASDAAKKDETASNWMSKFERLRVTEYPEPLSAEPSLVVRVDFADAEGQALGFVELAKLAAGEDKPEYYAKSELTRGWASVSSSAATQLEQDLDTVLNR